MYEDIFPTDLFNLILFLNTTGNLAHLTLWNIEPFPLNPSVVSVPVVQLGSVDANKALQQGLAYLP